MPKPKIVMAFGTFDVIHKGHWNFLKQAKRLGDRLVVSIGRDIHVRKIKGARPWHSERSRLAAVKALGIADRVMLGDTGHYMRHIKRVAPAVIALGYDQKAYTETLRADLKKAGLQTKVVRLKSFRPHLYKSSKLKAKVVK